MKTRVIKKAADALKIALVGEFGNEIKLTLFGSAANIKAQRSAVTV